MDDGETCLPELGGLRRLPKSTCNVVSIVLSSWTVSRHVTQFLRFLMLVVAVVAGFPS